MLSGDEIKKAEERKLDYNLAKARIGKDGSLLLDLALSIPNLYDYSSDETFYILDFRGNRKLEIYLSEKGKRGKKRKLMREVYGYKKLIPLLIAFQISAKEKHDINPVNKDKFADMITDKWLELEKALSSFGSMSYSDVSNFLRSTRFRKFYEIEENLEGNLVTLKHPVKEVRIK